MKIGELVEELEALQRIGILPGLDSCEPVMHDMRERTTGDSASSGDSNGVHLCTRLNGEILYIGKGAFSREALLASSALRRPAPGSGDASGWLRYRDETADEALDPGTRESILRGEYLVWTLPVAPEYSPDLVEVHLQLIHRHASDTPPPLNRRAA